MLAAPRVRAAGLGGDAADSRLARLVAGLLAGQPRRSRSLASTARGASSRSRSCRRWQGRVVRLAQASSQLHAVVVARLLAHRLPVGRAHLHGRARRQRPPLRHDRALPRLVARRHVDRLRARAARCGSASKVLATQVIWKPDWSPDGDDDRVRALRRHPRRDAGGCRATRSCDRRRRTERRRSGRSTGRSSRTRVGGARLRRRGQRRSNAAPGSSRDRTATLSPLSWAPDGRRCSRYTADGKLVRLTWLDVDVAHGVLAQAAEVGAVVLARRPATATSLPTRRAGRAVRATAAIRAGRRARC